MPTRPRPFSVTPIVALLLIGLPGARAQSFGPQSGEPLRLRATERPNLVAVHAGLGILSLINDRDVDARITFNGDTTDYAATANGSLAYSLTYDRRVTPRFSLGAALARQSNRIDDFRTADRQLVAGASIRANRTLVSARGLVYYGRSPSVEFYSGLRVGLTVWNFRVRDLSVDRLDDLDLPIPPVSGVLPHLQVVAFGIRAEPVPGLSLGAELASGFPHLLAAQAGFTF